MKTKGKDRGYIERQEISHQGIADINISFTEPITNIKNINGKETGQTVKNKDTTDA